MVTKPARAVLPYLSPIWSQCGRQTSPCNRPTFCYHPGRAGGPSCDRQHQQCKSTTELIKPRMAEYYSKLAGNRGS